MSARLGGLELAKQAVVIGAGMIGLMTAYYLRGNGLDVTVVDAGEPGMGCSFGNAGFICPSLSAPLPGPGLVLHSLLWALRGDSPLYIKPQALPRLLPWLLRFWGHCNESEQDAGLAAMLAFNLRTVELFDRLRADGVAFEMHEEGLLVAFLDEQGLEREFRELRKIERHGFPAPQRLDRDAAQALESNLSDRVVGGVLLPAERHVQPRSLSLGLMRHLEQVGVEFRANTRVDGLDLRDGKIAAATAQRERIGGDFFLLTAGVCTRQLAAMANVRLPLEAGKGYSVTLPAMGEPFRHALYFGDTKVVLSQYRDEVRIAGTMEFSGYNTTLDAKRVHGLRKAAARYLRALPDERGRAWTGMRPMTPDGLPVIGRLPGVTNAFVSTGHSMNGVFMAPVSGEALAELILDGKTRADIGAFDPRRFVRH